MKIGKSPSAPIREKSRERREGKEKDRGSKKGFLGMNFPPGPRARSSSAGVLGKDKGKGKSDGDGGLSESQNPASGKAQDRTLIEGGWPGHNGLLQVT